VKCKTPLEKIKERSEDIDQLCTHDKYHRESCVNPSVPSNDVAIQATTEKYSWNNLEEQSADDADNNKRWAGSIDNITANEKIIEHLT
jgi:hypothetical protein